MAAQVELSIQNHTYVKIDVSLECLEMPYESSGGCYFDEIYFFENYLESVPEYSYGTGVGFTIQGDEFAFVKQMKYALNQFKFKYAGSYLKYSATEDLYFQFDTRDAHYYGCSPFMGHDVNIRLVKVNGYYKIWFYPNTFDETVTNSTYPSTQSGWSEVSQSTVEVWQLENQTHCDIRWDINPPETPQMLTVAWDNDHPKLTWNSNTEPDMQSYKIWKYAEGSSMIVATVPHSNSNATHSWVDNSVSPAGKFDPVYTYSYKVKAVDNSNYESLYSNQVSISGTGAIWKKNSKEENNIDITTYALNSNYPNPFNPTTQIGFQIPKNSFVNLIVYNSVGQKVATLVNQNLSSGKYSVEFEAKHLPSGVYIYKIQAGEFSNAKKMILTK